jgi:Phospholipase_D-nuclease N-terminal
MGFGFGGSLIGLIILVLDIWAIVKILQGGGPVERKILWILLIVILPVIGLIIWLIAGRR